MRSTRGIKILLVLLLSVGMGQGRRASAKELDIEAYGPAPFGSYEQLRLVPRATLTDSCKKGGLYYDSSYGVKLCYETGGVGRWEPLTGLWSQVDSNIFLSDQDIYPYVRVGIGTNTPQEKLHIAGGIMAKGTLGYGNVLAAQPDGAYFLWYPRKAAMRIGYTVGSFLADDQILDYSSVLGGYANVVQSSRSVIGGGTLNTISSGSEESGIGGGFSHSVSGQVSFVGGGGENSIDGNYGVILGGRKNTIANVAYGTIAGGDSNQVARGATYAFIPGGVSNRVVSYKGAVISPGTSYAENGIYQTNIGGLDGFINEGNYSTRVSVYGGEITQASYATVATSSMGKIDGSGDYSVVFGMEGGQVSGGRYSISTNSLSYTFGDFSFSGMGIKSYGDYVWHMGPRIQINAGADCSFFWGGRVADTYASYDLPPSSVVFFSPDQPSAMQLGIGREPLYPLHMASGTHVTGGGDFCTAAGTCLDTLSDRALKTRVRPITHALKRLWSLRSYSFDWQPRSGYGRNKGLREIGFLAQEVQEVNPDWVAQNAAGYKVINKKAIRPYLVEGVKELEARRVQQMRRLKTKWRRIIQRMKAIAERQKDLLNQQAKQIQAQREEISRLKQLYKEKE